MSDRFTRAVHEGVTLAILKQNNIKTDRDIFQRLADRRVNISDIAGYVTRREKYKQVMIKALTTLLSIPCYAGFMELAMSISDDHEKGLIKDLNFFDEMCRAVTARISEMKNPGPGVHISSPRIPVVMARAFGALASGIKFQE